ncbi:hypothetical protein GQ457_09G018600 [Hibiscus cannabinus]
MKKAWKKRERRKEPTIVELQARVLLHLVKDSKLKSTTTFLGISFLLFPCIFILWVAKETKLETRERDSIEPLQVVELADESHNSNPL